MKDQECMVVERDKDIGIIALIIEMGFGAIVGITVVFLIQNL